MSTPKTVVLSAKCSDLCYARLDDENGNQIGQEHDGYVPDWMPDEHYGDYVMIEIDLETGKIINWKRPSLEALQETFKF